MSTFKPGRATVLAPLSVCTFPLRATFSIFHFSLLCMCSPGVFGSVFFRLFSAIYHLQYANFQRVPFLFALLFSSRFNHYEPSQWNTLWRTLSEPGCQKTKLIINHPTRVVAPSRIARYELNRMKLLNVFIKLYPKN